MDIFGNQINSVFENIRITDDISVGGNISSSSSEYVELGVAPSNPSAGNLRVYADTGDSLHILNSAGGDTIIGGAVLASSVTMLNAGGAAYTDVQDTQTIFHSSGYTSGGAITDNLDGTINVELGEGFLRSSDNYLADLYFVAWPTLSVSLTNLALNYVVVEWNTGTPRVAVTLILPTSNDKFTLATVYRNGTTLHITEGAKHKVADHASSMIKRMESLQYIAKSDDGGTLVSEVGTRRIAITAGEFWLGLSSFTLPAINTNVADTFYYYYNRLSYVLVAAQTTIDNLQYDLNGVLTTLNNNQYGVHWVYKGSDGDTYVIYGIGSYTLNEAENVGKPVTTPAHFQKHAILIAKIIILKSSTTITRIVSAFEKPIGTATTSINTVNGVGTDEAIVRFDANGNTIQNSGVLIDDSNNITGVGNITFSDIPTILSVSEPITYTADGHIFNGAMVANGFVSALAGINSPTYYDNYIPSVLARTGIGGANNFITSTQPAIDYALTTGVENCIYGNLSGMEAISTNKSTFMGHSAGRFQKGDSNTAVGHSALLGVTAISNGYNNSAFGYDSMSELTTGYKNCSFGANSSVGLVSGIGNTSIGNETAISNNNYQIAIGYGAVCDAKNQCCIGSFLLSEIRSDSDAGCDLGSTGKRFRNLHLGGELFLTSTTKSFTPPRLTNVQISALTGKVDGNVVFNTDSLRLQYYDGSLWRSLNPELQSLVSIMTSNTTPSPFVISASSVNGAYAAWKAFDRDITTAWITSLSSFDTSTNYATVSRDPLGTGAFNCEWIKVDCGVNKTITRCIIESNFTVNFFNPVDFEIWVSNSVSSGYTRVHSEVDFQWADTIPQTKNITIQKPFSGRYVIFICTRVSRTGGSTDLRINGIEYWGY